MSNCSYASNQLAKVLKRIRNICQETGRNPRGVRLVGASKMQPVDLLQDFVRAGLVDLGENYLQEGLHKQAALQELGVRWHFIGQIQSNKTRLIAEHFTWVHGVDRVKIARRLGEQNPNVEPINILLQINIDEEASKNGVDPDQATEVCAQICELEGVVLRGLMLLPKPRKSESEQRAVFADARNLLRDINQKLSLTMDQLSMGMSGDLEAAIAEGSTIVRIGTDLFGARQPDLQG